MPKKGHRSAVATHGIEGPLLCPQSTGGSKILFAYKLQAERKQVQTVFRLGATREEIIIIIYSFPLSFGAPPTTKEHEGNISKSISLHSQEREHRHNNNTDLIRIGEKQ